MATAEMTSSIRIGALDMSVVTSREEDGLHQHDPTLPAGKAGTLTDRTDADTGIITVAEGHGITDSDTVDVYWEGGMRYGVDVTGTTSTTVSINLGDGDDLPAQDYDVIVTKQVTIDDDFDGDLLKFIVVVLSKRGHIEFQENDGTSIEHRELVADEPWTWISDTGVANPLTGNPVGKMVVTCGEAADGNLKVGILYDSAG